jgi:hypothetical protein
MHDYAAHELVRRHIAALHRDADRARLVRRARRRDRTDDEARAPALALTPKTAAPSIERDGYAQPPAA